MINPDPVDARDTQVLASELNTSNLRVACRGADSLSSEGTRYDCIWSISVVEHISGKYDDSMAMRLLYGALAPGGVLAITVPVDKTFKEEFRDSDVYGLGAKRGEAGEFFFQRRYTEVAIQRRLLEPIGSPDCRMTFFGEIAPGLYDSYERQWRRDGLLRSVLDPMEIGRNYRCFGSWQDMPGMGVCGLRIVKPHGATE
jgi:SAM-dependent methyltransferase